MKAVVRVYEEKEDYIKDKPSYGEEFYSITEAISEKRKIIRKIRKTGDFIAFRIYDSLGDLKHEMPSEPVTVESILFQSGRNVKERQTI